MNRRRFTDDQIAAALQAADGNVASAAASLGCSAFPVDEYRRRMGMAAPKTLSIRNVIAYDSKRSFTDIALLVAILRHGDDTAAIAKKLRCKPVVVNKHRRRL